MGFGGGARPPPLAAKCRSWINGQCRFSKAVYAIQRKPILVYEKADASKGWGLVLTKRGLSKTVVFNTI